MKNTKRTIALLLAAVLMLSLMLTACKKSGDNPTGDNSTPGTSSTPGASGNGDSTPTTSGTNTPAKKNFAWLEPGKYDTEKKVYVDEQIAYIGGDEVDIDKLILEAFTEYNEYINENITLESVRTAIVVSRVTTEHKGNKNLTKMPQSSLTKVNDYLKSNGAEPLDSTNYKQDIAALAIAASLSFVSNWDNAGSALYDITMAFCYAYSGTNEPDEYIGNGFMNSYYILLG